MFYYLHFRERKNELEGEIFEMLLTFSDFMSFKEMFLDFKAVSVLFYTKHFFFKTFEVGKIVQKLSIDIL